MTSNNSWDSGWNAPDQNGNQQNPQQGYQQGYNQGYNQGYDAGYGWETQQYPSNGSQPGGNGSGGSDSNALKYATIAVGVLLLVVLGIGGGLLLSDRDDDDSAVAQSPVATSETTSTPETVQTTITETETATRTATSSPQSSGGSYSDAIDAFDIDGTDFGLRSGLSAAVNGKGWTGYTQAYCPDNQVAYAVFGTDEGNHGVVCHIPGRKTSTYRGGDGRDNLVADLSYDSERRVEVSNGNTKYIFTPSQLTIEQNGQVIGREKVTDYGYRKLSDREMKYGATD